MRVFHKVQYGAGVQAKVLSPHALGDVAQGQEAHAFVALVLGHQRVEAAHRVNQAGVQMHGALGFSGGARRVDQNRQVLWLAGVQTLLQFIRMLRQIRAAQGAQRIQTDDVRLIKLVQPLHIEDHNLAQQRQALAHFQRLVELLIVFDKQHGGTRVLAQVVHLRRGIGRINAVGDAATGQHADVGPDPFDRSVGQNRSALALGKAQAQQAAGNFPHRIGALVPGPATPQSQVLLAQPDRRAALFHCVPEQCRNCLACEHDVAIGFDV